MYCAVCAEHTTTTLCSACGQGALLDSRYMLGERIGKGPTSAVWKALRVSDGETVAIKETVMSRERGTEAAVRAEREVMVLRQLHHPGLPAYIEHLQTSSGRTRSLWLVMAYVEGSDLERGLAEHRYTEGEVLSVMAELCSILGYLHTLSPPVIHRDLKPSNIIRRADGSLAIVDFGAVRDVMGGLLGGSTVAGTFGYMAPEQFSGDATPKTDLYALGAVAVALLTRQDPSTFAGRERYGERLESGRLDWRSHAQVSAATARLIDDLLSPDPNKRPPSAEAVRSRIGRLNARAEILPASSPSARRSAMLARERLAGVGVVGLSLGAAVSFALLCSSLFVVMGLVDIPKPAWPEHTNGSLNVQACRSYVETFNAAPCGGVDLNLDPTQLCPHELDDSSCDLSGFYECMARGVRCNGDFIDLSGQAACKLDCP